MSFIEGFYSFNIQLNDSTRNVYERFRLKTPRHPEESLEHLYSRILAFSFAYEEDMTFSEGLYSPKDPTIWKKDVLGEVHTWVEVGCPSKEKIIKAERNSKRRIKVFFYDPQQIAQFCHHLRGSTTNWSANVEFYEIDSVFLERLSTIKKSSSKWDVTIVDNMFYLVFDDIEFETEIKSIDIWQRYQESILNNDSV